MHSRIYEKKYNIFLMNKYNLTNYGMINFFFGLFKALKLTHFINCFTKTLYPPYLHFFLKKN